ncbi:proto-oncogene tyrosine-protein kinase ROS-like [Anoplolepis gracilipes]|uniref:proto-oncogene tyrosine-protein kinase ROS-like n=1 Tax=Anoplolepis gracilipes TaxID=354296 RepID=UPI003B9FCFEB
MTNIELARLYKMPFGNVVNALYTPRIQHNWNFALTLVEEQQIFLTKFVGSGAFGKIFEGTIKNLEGSDKKPIAIKMLRKNASSQQTTEFFREVKLMSHFRHTNVLRLLGICIDVDSLWLILELMETDLLKYLRESRTLLLLDSHVLRLQDLLAICEDVARRERRRFASYSLDDTRIFGGWNIYFTERCLGIRSANVGNYVIG